MRIAPQHVSLLVPRGWSESSWFRFAILGRLGLQARFTHLQRKHEFHSRAIVGEQRFLFDSVLGGFLSRLRTYALLEPFVCPPHHRPERQDGSVDVQFLASCSQNKVANRHSQLSRNSNRGDLLVRPNR